MDKKSSYKELAETVVAKLRDENYANYLATRNYARSMTLTEYLSLPRNPGYASEYQQRDDERFGLLNSLSAEQSDALDRLILSTLDNAAFNFLRKIEENKAEGKGVGLTIDGKNLNIQDELQSGTLFGEYFLWVEENSKYGPFQH